MLSFPSQQWPGSPVSPPLSPEQQMGCSELLARAALPSPASHLRVTGDCVQLCSAPSSHRINNPECSSVMQMCLVPHISPTPAQLTGQQSAQVPR